MNWMSLLGGMMGSQGGGQQGGGSQNGQPPPGGWGQGASQMGQEQQAQVQQAMEYGTTGTPSSLLQALENNQSSQQAMLPSTADFSQFTAMGGGPGVLPEMNQQQAPEIMLPQGVQSYPVGSNDVDQLLQQTQQISQLAGSSASRRPSQDQLSQAPPVAPQTGGNSYFNMTGSAPSSPSSTQGFDPNMFLRMSEGYNRGGLLGSLGMLLTDYK